jgi:hypothetical protein
VRLPILRFIGSACKSILCSYVWGDHTRALMFRGWRARIRKLKRATTPGNVTSSCIILLGCVPRMGKLSILWFTHATSCHVIMMSSIKNMVIKLWLWTKHPLSWTGHWSRMYRHLYGPIQEAFYDYICMLFVRRLYYRRSHSVAVFAYLNSLQLCSKLYHPENTSVTFKWEGKERDRGMKETKERKKEGEE